MKLNKPKQASHANAVRQSLFPFIRNRTVVSKCENFYNKWATNK